ncbi:MAG: hypothetical protein K9G76_01770 [Bacteroidales bacterium]|nr:hypothetical protein [Bacteroidales bacterium]MCF8403282.1 hypothetical protein [Bacteroidales bacterium]
MKHKFGYFISIIFLFCFSPAFVNAQSSASIENIDFFAEGNNLVITYDIAKAKTGETFEIWAKVVMVSGNVIIPNSISGDIGPGVIGGANKRIIWDVQADNANLNEEFHVEVFARSGEKTNQTSQTEKPTKIKTKKEGISAGGAMLLSAVLPGLGKTVANHGGAHWMWGVIGYSCVAGTIVMNNQAYNAYEEYKLATTAEDRDDYFQQAEDNDLYSKVFLGTAATIWIVDIITTGVYASKKRKQKNSNFSMHYSFDPFSGKPLVGFNYKF